MSVKRKDIDENYNHIVTGCRDIEEWDKEGIING